MMNTGGRQPYYTSCGHSIDAFPFAYRPSLGGKSHFSPALGACCTIIIWVLSTLFSAYLLFKYLKVDNPIINVTKQIISDDGVVLNAKSHPLIFGLYRPADNIFLNDQSMFSLEAELVSSNIEVVGGGKIGRVYSQVLPMSYCSQEMDNSGHYGAKINLNDVFCLSGSGGAQPKVWRREGNNELQVTNIKVTVRRCQAGQNQACQSDQAIDSYLQDAKLWIGYADYTTSIHGINAGALESSNGQSVLSSLQHSLSTKDTQCMELSLSKATLIEHKYFLPGFGSNTQRFLLPRLASSSSCSAPTTGAPVLAAVSLELDRHQTVFTSTPARTVLEYIAILGGLVFVLSSVSSYFIHKIKKINLFMDLADKIIDKEEFYQMIINDNNYQAESKMDIIGKSSPPDSPRGRKSRKFSKPIDIDTSESKKLDPGKPIVRRANYEPKPSRINPPTPMPFDGPIIVKSPFKTASNIFTIEVLDPTHKDYIYMENQFRPQTSNTKSTEREKPYVFIPDEGQDRQIVRDSNIGAVDISRKSSSSRINTENKLQKSLNILQDISVPPPETLDKKIPPTSVDLDEMIKKKEDSPQTSFVKLDDHQKEQHSEYSRVDNASMKESQDLVSHSNRLFKMRTEIKRYERLQNLQKDFSKARATTGAFISSKLHRQRLTPLLETVESELSAAYDLYKIMEIMEDLDKLKNLLLTKEQLLLFDLLPSTKLRYEDTGHSCSVEKDYLRLSSTPAHNYVEMRKDARAAYRKISSNHSKSEIDKNLIKAFGFIFDPKHNNSKRIISMT
jgi:hypothetical protein